jgi:hypothetical protein
MKQIRALFIGLGVLFVFQNTFAQSPRPITTNNPTNPLPDWVIRNEQKRKDMDRINGKDENGMIAGRQNPRIPRLPTTKPDGKPYTKEELKKIKTSLEPNKEDLEKYKDFLKSSKTGLFRLFPDFDCEFKGVIRFDGNCANFIPGSWSYSFRTKTYPGQDFFDLRFSNEDLVADGFLAQEILVPLGDVLLEKTALTSAGMKFLNEFKPELQSQEMKKQFNQIANVVEADGFRYAKRVKAVENVTYAIRIIAYHPENNIASRFAEGMNRESSRFLEDVKRLDLTLAFRIIRKDADGSISVLWKELKRQNAPKIIFQKTDKLSDPKER